MNRKPLIVTLNNYPESCNLCRIGLLSNYTDSCKLFKTTHFGLLVIKSGRIITQLSDKKVEFKKGDICVVKPDIPFRFEYPEEGTEVYCLEFSKEFLCYDPNGESIKDRFLTYLIVEMALEKSDNSVLKVSIPINEQNLIVKLTEQFYLEFNRRRECMFDILHGNLLMIMNTLGWDFLYQPKNISAELRYRRINKLMQDSLHYINTHYMERITIQSITKTFATSKTVYCTLFKQTMGITFHTYLNNLRCEKVAHLLTESDCSLEEICEMTGYADISSLYRNFTEHFGKSPGKYRKEYS